MPKHLYLNKNAKVENRIEDLLKRMTLEEKCAQLISILGYELMDNPKKKFDPEKAKKHLKNGLGQAARITGLMDCYYPAEAARAVNDIQKYIRKNTRLKIPAMVHEEALSGMRSPYFTIFPVPMGLGSTFNPDITGKIGGVLKKHAMLVGAQHLLCPVLDLARDARWGRMEETYGEDPYLTATLGLSYVKGIQGKDRKVYSTLKHFVGHAGSAGGRNLAPVYVTARELREEHMFPFEVSVRLGNVGSVMNAYHSVDGIPMVTDRKTQTEILRGEWGFDGIIVSDYCAIDMLENHNKVAANMIEAAKKSLEAGIDLEACFPKYYYKPLIEGIKTGQILEETLNASVRRVLKAKFELGLFEKPFVNIPKMKYFDPKKDRLLSRQAAREAVILMTNKGVLPLKGVKKIAVIGPNAHEWKNMLGDYCYVNHRDGECPDPVKGNSVFEGLKKFAPKGVEINYSKGCELGGEDRNGFNDALCLADNSDAVIAVVGESSSIFKGAWSGEGIDRAYITLPGIQEELLKDLKKTGKPLIVVVISGRSLGLPWVKENADAYLQVFMPGYEGGNAVAEVIFGLYNPGGRMPVSTPYTVGQIPVNFNMKNGSKKGYVDCPEEPLFPFGHGLSYTSFAYGNLKQSAKTITPSGDIEISCAVMNTGWFSGDEVVQLYLKDEFASVVRPMKELKGYKRIHLKPGESKTIRFKVNISQMSFLGADMEWIVEPGRFLFEIGSSAADIRLKGNFKVNGETKVYKSSERTFLTKVTAEKGPKLRAERSRRPVKAGSNAYSHLRFETKQE